MMMMMMNGRNLNEKIRLAKTSCVFKAKYNTKKDDEDDDVFSSSFPDTLSACVHTIK